MSDKPIQKSLTPDNPVTQSAITPGSTDNAANPVTIDIPNPLQALRTAEYTGPPALSAEIVAFDPTAPIAPDQPILGKKAAYTLADLDVFIAYGGKFNECFEAYAKQFDACTTKDAKGLILKDSHWLQLKSNVDLFNSRADTFGAYLWKNEDIDSKDSRWLRLNQIRKGLKVAVMTTGFQLDLQDEPDLTYENSKEYILKVRAEHHPDLKSPLYNF